ncbi:MAG: putative ABC transport system permease protein, partial [Limisphaerales bacterium]
TSDGELDIITSLNALNKAVDYDLAGNFNNLSSGDNTYMLLSPSKDLAWLQSGVTGIYERHYQDSDQEFLAGLRVRPLAAMNTAIWEAVGLPVMDSVRLLALLVLIVAIVNYTNLATAQSLGRNREIGMRKTMGASRRQLVAQFLVESVCVAFLALIISLLALAVLVPFFNTAWDKALSFNLLTTLPWMLLTTVIVGMVAGAYPAYLISQSSPIQALRSGGSSGGKGGAFRTGMLILQFAISIFMLAMVAVVFLQNRKVEESAEIYPKSEIITLSRLGLESIQAKLETLRTEVEKIPGVERMAYGSQLPYEQSNSGFQATPEAGNKDKAVLLTQIWIDQNFFAALNIPIIAGRSLSSGISSDTTNETIGNVILNELALSKLGFTSPSQAIGQQFFDYREDGENRTYTIVGVAPDQNFQGFHNQVKPLTFKMRPSSFRNAAIRVSSGDMATIRAQVEQTWEDLIPDYPIQSSYLEDEFRDTYGIYQNIANILGGFAFVAMLLSLLGLFGLAAFMAATRTKEIGIRKVMGASSTQITRMLIWRFSKPVMWSVLLALPLAYLAANQFLQFFADRINLVEVIVVVAGVVAVLVSWTIVGIHALRIARSSPILALRHE